MTEVSQNIAAFDKVNNTIKFENRQSGTLNIADALPTTPFVTINQLLDARFYNNNSFYVNGSEFTYVSEGELTQSVTHIELEARPKSAAFVRLFIDGEQKSSGQFSVNINEGLTQNANIVYTKTATDTTFRAEADIYTVPVIEIGDAMFRLLLVIHSQ